MTHLTDDELGTLLRETFAAHEHLAHPDRAAALATVPSPRPRLGRALLAAAAAVALVAVGTSYVVAQGSHAGRPSADPTRSPSASGQPPLPVPQTDAGNRAAAVKEAEQVAARLPVYPGAHETDAAGIPELRNSGLTNANPPGHTVVRTRWWTVSGTTSKAVARWFAAHPASGFHTDGGPNGVGGSGDGTVWVDEVYWYQGQAELLPAVGTSVEVQSTTTAGGVGVRLSVSTVWDPARPLASFVQDVSSIDVHSTHDLYGTQERTTHRSYTISDPARVLAAARAYNDLPGMTPVIHSCPLQRDSYTDRITFHTATGDVSAVEHTQACGFGLTVHRDGHLVNPQLGDTGRLFAVLGIHH